MPISPTEGRHYKALKVVAPKYTRSEVAMQRLRREALRASKLTGEGWGGGGVTGGGTPCLRFF